MSNFTIRDVIEFWDSVADIYDSTNDKYSHVHAQRFTESLKYLDLKPGAKILNVWARTGNACQYLRNACRDIILINAEMSLKLISIAKTKQPEEIFTQVSLHQLPFKSSSFDYVLSLETLEHAPNPILLLGEIYRVLKPAGTLVMSLPPATMEFPLKIYETFLPNDHGEGPHKFLSSQRVKGMLKEVRFELILHKGTLLTPLGPKFLRDVGERIIEKGQNTFISELGSRQFYVCRKAS